MLNDPAVALAWLCVTATWALPHEHAQGRSAERTAEHDNGVVDNSCCSCASVTEVPVAAHCLATCGFAIYRHAYDPELLRTYERKFTAWFNDEQTFILQALDSGEVGVFPRSAFISYNENGMLRGRRAHVVLPTHIANDGIIFNRLVARSHHALLAELGLVGVGPMLNFAAIIHSSSHSYDQSWHSDAQHADGIKVQLPLVDVTRELGPVEIEPVKGKDDCPVIYGETKLGDVIIYRHKTGHRGAANRARGANRTAVDMSFMLPKTVEKDNFMAKSKFPPPAFEAMSKYRQKFAEMCKKDPEVTCASKAEITSIAEGDPYQGMPAATGIKDGFQGDYQGDGKGAGTWIDPNGAKYQGEFLDGMFHGHGRYEYPNGDWCEGEFAHGMRNGYSRYDFGNGELYEGQFKDNQRHGQARIRSGTGFSFEGEVREEMFHKGTMTTPAGEVHKGHFDKGQLTGDCSITRAEGWRYEGECLYGVPHGLGKALAPNGNVEYEGHWKSGAPLERRGSLLMSAKFERAQPLPHCSITNGEGMTYEGECFQGIPHGVGTLRDTTGSVKFVGRWDTGSPIVDAAEPLPTRAGKGRRQASETAEQSYAMWGIENSDTVQPLRGKGGKGRGYAGTPKVAGNEMVHDDDTARDSSEAAKRGKGRRPRGEL